MIQLIDFLQEQHKEFDKNKHRWITIKDKNMQNQHIMLNKKDGTIAAGMGGKHNGDTLDDVYDGDKNKSSSSSDKSSKEVSTTKNTDATDSKTSTKKLSVANIRKTITDEHIKKMNNTLNILQKDINNNTTGYSFRQGISRDRESCVNTFSKLPKSIQSENREEYDNLLRESDPKRLYKKLIGISRLANKIKKRESLDADDKALLDKALEAGGLDKFIDDSLKELSQARIKLMVFRKKCAKLKSEYDSTPEGKKENKNKRYALDFNTAGQWIDHGPTGGFGTYWRGSRTEYNEKRRVKEIDSVLDDIERDIKKSGEVAEISIERNKSITIDKSGKYFYNGTAIERDKAINLIKDNKNVSVNIKQVSEQPSDETKSNKTNSTNKRKPSLRDILNKKRKAYNPRRV